MNLRQNYWNQLLAYMVYCIPYMVETVGKKKKDKTWQNEMDTKTVKIATSEIHFSILK